MTEPIETRTEPTETRRRGRAGGVLAALAIVVVALAAAFLLWPSAEPPPPEPPPPPPVAAVPPEVAPAPPPAPEPEASAQDARGLLEGVSGDAAFRRWLGAGDLVRRWAIVTDNVAEGVSPRKQLDFLDPGRPFSVERRDGKTFVAAKSYARYDGFADAVGSVDAQALARAYRRLHRVLEAAYRALGYPDGSLDRVTAKALRRIQAAPVRDGEVEVLEEDGVWLYADPALERLSEVEKHLLRMGPRNARILQAKAKELREALGLPFAEPMKAR